MSFNQLPKCNKFNVWLTELC